MDVNKLVLCACFLLNGIRLKAQPAPQNLRSPVSFPSRLMRLDSLAAFVRRETGFIFAYNSGNISPGRELAIPPDIRDLQKLLRLLYKTQNLNFSLHLQYIVLRYERIAHPIAQATTADGSAAYRPISFSPAMTSHAAATVDDQSHPAPAGTKPLKFSQGAGSIITPAASEHLPGDPFSFRAEAGIAVSEVLYFNPMIHIGFSWLYGLAGFSSNGQVSGLRYGVGTSWTLPENFSLYGMASFGHLSRNFAAKRVDTAGASAITVRGSLAAISIGISRMIGQHWRIEFGPVYNRLTTRYADSAGAVSLDNPIYAGNTSTGNPDKVYYTLKAPYLLSNTFSLQKSSNLKTWIGLQAGIFFLISPRPR